MLGVSCQSNKPAQPAKETQIENPAPLTEPKTDTLKSYLDRERQRRKQP